MSDVILYLIGLLIPIITYYIYDDDKEFNINNNEPGFWFYVMYPLSSVLCLLLGFCDIKEALSMVKIPSGIIIFVLIFNLLVKIVNFIKTLFKKLVRYLNYNKIDKQ